MVISLVGDLGTIHANAINQDAQHAHAEVASFLSSHIVLIEDIDIACRVRDSYLIDYLYSSRSCEADILGGDTLYKKFGQERILSLDHVFQSNLAATFHVYDLDASVQNLPPSILLSEALKVKEKLGEFFQKNARYLCDKTLCENEPVKLETSIKSLLKNITKSKISNPSELYFFIVEEYEEQNREEHFDTSRQGVLSETSKPKKRVSDYLLWKLREEQQHGVTRFFIDGEYQQVQAADGEKTLIGASRLGVVRRTIKHSVKDESGDLQSGLKKELQAYENKIDKHSEVFVYACIENGNFGKIKDTEGKKEFKILDGFSLNAAFHCGLCNRSFRYSKQKSNVLNESLEVIKVNAIVGDIEEIPTQNGSSPYALSRPEKRINELVSDDLNESITFIKNRIIGKKLKECTSIAKEFIHATLADTPLGFSLSDLKEEERYFLLLSKLKDEELQNYLFFVSCSWLKENSSDFLYKSFFDLLALVRKKGASIVLYGASDECIDKAKKKKHIHLVTTDKTKNSTGRKNAVNQNTNESDITVEIKGSSISLSTEIGAIFPHPNSKSSKKLELNSQTVLEALNIRNTLAMIFVKTMKARVQGVYLEDFLSKEKYGCTNCKGLGFFIQELSLGYSCARSCRACLGSGVGERTNEFTFGSLTYREVLTMPVSDIPEELLEAANIRREIQWLKDSDISFLTLGSRIMDLAHTSKIRLGAVLKELYGHT